MIAKLIVKNNKEITLITNMFEISSLIPVNSKANFIFIGGGYNVFVCGSSYSTSQIKEYRCDKAFIVCTGFDIKDGNVSTIISEDASTKKLLCLYPRNYS